MKIDHLGCFLHHSRIWSARGVCPHPQNDSGYYISGIFSLWLDSNIRNIKGSVIHHLYHVNNTIYRILIKVLRAQFFSEYKKKRGAGEKKRAERVAKANGGEKRLFFYFKKTDQKP